MYGYIYLLTNTVTGMKYIGKHKSTSFDPNYYGSGIRVLRDLEKYDVSVYTREVLAWCETLEELNEREKFFISLYDAVSSDDYMNFSAGGDGGDLVTTMDPQRYAERSAKISASLMGHAVDDTTRLKISKKQLAAWQNEDSDLRERRKLIDKEKWSNPNIKETHLNAIHQYWETHKEERHEQMSANIHKNWASDEYRQKQYSTRASEEYKNLMTEKLKGKTKGFITIHKEDSQKRVPPEMLDQYLSEGWSQGCKPFSEEHKARISECAKNRHNASKKVYCVELDTSFSSISAACKDLSLSPYMIRKSLNHAIPVHGYTFRWKEGD